VKKKAAPLKYATAAAVTLLLISTLVLAAAPHLAVNAASTHPVAPLKNGSIDPEELQTFADKEITAELNESGVPGAVIVVVKDGTILLAKGYGTMDKETNKPVVVNQTLFRAASVTKLFTWTAVMQLVEQGKLDLDADVNKYLKTFQIPQTYPQPITLANLMSHNAGFESDQALGWVPSAADLLPLGDYVARYIPARVRPPGELSVYSNYGASLAGYIVEQASGMPFDEYVQANILEPLGMERTTLEQPLPAELALDMSKSYVSVNGQLQAVPLGYYNGKPAGALCATATDMAHFIIAHLQDGAYEGSRILQDPTAEEMHSQLFTMDPRVPGFAHGFLESEINGQRIIGHFGELEGFRSSLMLIPKQNLGWFIVYNGESDTASPGSFLIAFLNHYFPAEPYVSPNPPADFSQRASQFTGYYRDARLSHTTFQKLTSLFIEFDVASTQRGTLSVRGEEYVEAEPLLFKPYGTSNPWNDTLLFLKDSSGQVQYFSYAVGTFERVPWFETSMFTWTLIITCSAFFVSMPIVLLTRAFVDRGKPKQKTASSKWAKGSRWLSCAFSLLFVCSVVGIRFAAGNLNVWYGVMAAGAVGSTLALASVPLAALSWKQRYWSLPERLHYTAVTLAALAFVWFLYNWNLLSLRTP